jgi:transposase
VAWIIAEAEARNATICIPTRKNRVQPRAHDQEIYKSRHLIENFFCRSKEFRRVALRTDKSNTSFKTIIQACATLINTKLNLNSP